MIRKLLIVSILIVGLGAVFILVAFPPISATHPALKDGQLPELVPLRSFYADSSSRWRFHLSPDGKRIAWLESKWFKPALWVRDLEGEGSEIYHTPDRVRWYAWSPNGRYLLYLADRDGWENDQIVSIDVTEGGAEPRTYDFGRDVKAWIANIPPEGGDEILIAHNGRDRTKFDLYRLNLESGETVALDLISDRQVFWSFDREGNVFARKRSGANNNWHVELREPSGWREIASGGMEENFHILAQPDDKGELLAISDLGRDKRALVLRNVETGGERVLYGHEAVDLSWVRSHPLTLRPIMAVAYPGRQERFVFQENVADMIERIGAPADASLHLVSATHDFSKAIWEVEDDTHGWSKYLVDNDAQTVELIDEPPIAERAEALSEMEPVSIEAGDGLVISGYLTRPKGVSGPAPTVILVHGGPVARVRWGFDGLALWLANRGYAVLNVNYRGSAGYGRAFREAAVGEVSRKMHQDIVDARNWAVDQGVADPDRIAVMGGSFGGLKTLTALTQSPDLFAAGVSINGISDISTMLQEVPVYWTGWPDWYRKYIGDPGDPEDLADIRDRSPLYNAENVQSPILMIQGANDVRVIRDQSDRMVEALRRSGKDVRYTLLDGAGHSLSNMTWQTRILMFRQIERFLAQHLGGRADGFDYAVLGARIIP